MLVSNDTFWKVLIYVFFFWLALCECNKHKRVVFNVLKMISIFFLSKNLKSKIFKRCHLSPIEIEYILLYKLFSSKKIIVQRKFGECVAFINDLKGMCIL